MLLLSRNHYTTQSMKNCNCYLIMIMNFEVVTMHLAKVLWLRQICSRWRRRRSIDHTNHNVGGSERCTINITTAVDYWQEFYSLFLTLAIAIGESGSVVWIQAIMTLHVQDVCRQDACRDVSISQLQHILS